MLRSEKAGRKAGAERAYVLSKKLLNANTTPEAVSLIKEAGILTPVMESLIQAMMFHAKGRIRRAMDRCGRKNPMDFGILLFSLEEGLLAKAGEIDGIAREIRKD